jgi:hypothetical protein
MLFNADSPIESCCGMDITMRSQRCVSDGKNMRALIGLVVVAMAACSAPSEIVKTGATTYRVRTDAGGGNPSDAEIKTRGIARANEFCAAQGKRAVINVGQSTAWHLFSVQTAEVQFFCDDPLPARPATPASAP